MDWSLAMEDNRRMLKRIVAVLFALAGLAERLSALPWPVRVFVLAIMRSAEAVARDFVLETTQDYAAPLPVAMAPAILDALHAGDSLADAMRLAQSFRLLAVLLTWLADLDRLAAHNSGRIKRCIAPQAMITRLLAATRLERRQLFPTTAQLAVERRDSS